MGKYHVLFNPLSGNGQGEARAAELKSKLVGQTLIFEDIRKASQNYVAYFASMDEDDRVILCGGDGTINRFVNESNGCYADREILLYATGSGNDFLHDLGKEPGCDPFPINCYLENLPTVTVGNLTKKYINGIGYGIDGYCCEVGDKLRETTDKPVNYAGIAIKGLLFHYQPTNAEITVDGKKYTYRKVWLAPTMHGRFYGGGMMTTPKQDRLHNNGTDSLMVMYGTGKLKTLAVFPSIFKGEHVNHTEMVAIHTGHTITVTFDRPTALQIDGETVLGVTSYTIHTADTTSETETKVAESANA